MILRIWHGWTTPENAEEYERLIEEEIYDLIADKTGEGYLGYEFGRRDHEDEVEYVTITRFESWDAVERFVGEDYRQAHIPDEARKLLSDWDETADHYELKAAERV